MASTNPSCERSHQEAKILGLAAKPEFILAKRAGGTIPSRQPAANQEAELSGILSSKRCGVVELVQRPAVNRKVGGSIPPPTANTSLRAERAPTAANGSAKEQARSASLARDLRPNRARLIEGGVEGRGQTPTHVRTEVVIPRNTGSARSTPFSSSLRVALPRREPPPFGYFGRLLAPRPGPRTTT